MSNTKPTPPANTTVTENGALTHATSSSARVDFFFQVVPSSPADAICDLVKKSWDECRLDTLKLIFQLRDVRNGKNERKCFYTCLTWLLATHPDTFIANLKCVPMFGYWKDLLELLLKPTERSGKTLKGEGEDISNDKNFPRVIEAVVQLFATQLKEDFDLMEQKAKISLCAKWAPSPGKKHDKKFKLAQKIAMLMFPDCPEPKKREEGAPYVEPACLYKYRKALTAMRKYTCVPEVHMSANQWKKIVYTRVPSVCMANNRKIFAKHDEERYQAYLDAVKAGTATIASGAILPHVIIEKLLAGNVADGQALELQWTDKVNKIKAASNLPKCLSVVDVSGSMSGIPMQVAIALGLILSEVTEGPFKNHVITFHSTPSFFKVQGKSLRDRVTSIKNMPWGMNTNFAAVFDLLLDFAKTGKVDADDMPETIFVFSDMEFDAAQTGAFRTSHEDIKSKFRAMGFDMPQIVYWNLRHSSSIPVTKEEPGVAMVSGFSPAMLNLFLDGVELTPWLMIQKAIDTEEFEKLVVID